MKKLSKKKLITLIASVVLVVALSVAIPLTIAYLTDTGTVTGGATVGSYDLKFYTNSGATEVTDGLDVTLSGQGVATDVDFTMYNSGNIPMLVRLFVSVSMQDNIASTTDLEVLQSGFTITSSQYDYDDEQYSHYYWLYYNSQLAPSTHVDIISSIEALTSGYGNATVTINVSADAIAYSGNPYKLSQSPTGTDDSLGALTQDLLDEWTAWQ